MESPELKVAVLDDYQGAAFKMADWDLLPTDVEVTVFSDHLTSIDALVKRLEEFQIISTMRERTAFGRDLIVPFRMLGHTRAGQVLVSQRVRVRVECSLPGRFGRVRLLTLKGLDGHFEVAALVPGPCPERGRRLRLVASSKGRAAQPAWPIPSCREGTSEVQRAIIGGQIKKRGLDLYTGW